MQPIAQRGWFSLLTKQLSSQAHQPHSDSSYVGLIIELWIDDNQLLQVNLNINYGLLC